MLPSVAKAEVSGSVSKFSVSNATPGRANTDQRHAAGREREVGVFNRDVTGNDGDGFLVGQRSGIHLRYHRCTVAFNGDGCRGRAEEAESRRRCGGEDVVGRVAGVEAATVGQFHIVGGGNDEGAADVDSGFCPKITPNGLMKKKFAPWISH